MKSFKIDVSAPSELYGAMQLKRFTVILIALLGMALSLASCAGGERSGVRTEQTLHVAAAASLRFALPDIIARFQEEHPPWLVQATYGSSGTLYAQILNHAPFDLFLSADLHYPQQLIEQGMAGPDALFSYAAGHVVLWVRKDAPMDLRALGMDALLHPAASKVAMANPRLAPYGRAAEEALRSFGLYDQVAPRLVLGETIAQTAQFVESGAASIGLIALSLALAPPMRDQGVYWEIPTDRYTPIEQGGLRMNRTLHPEAARAFQTFLQGPEAKAILSTHGLQVPTP